MNKKENMYAVSPEGLVFGLDYLYQIIIFQSHHWKERDPCLLLKF